MGVVDKIQFQAALVRVQHHKGTALTVSSSPSFGSEPSCLSCTISCAVCVCVCASEVNNKTKTTLFFLRKFNLKQHLLLVAG